MPAGCGRPGSDITLDGACLLDEKTIGFLRARRRIFESPDRKWPLACFRPNCFLILWVARHCCTQMLWNFTLTTVCQFITI
jgi:hypothetical protein